MPIVIKEIQVKTTVVRNQSEDHDRKLELIQMKKELMKEVREYLHKEYIRKYEH